MDVLKITAIKGDEMHYSSVIKTFVALSLSLVAGLDFAAGAPQANASPVSEIPISKTVATARAKGVPQAMLDGLLQGKPQSLIVEFDAGAVEAAAKKQQVAHGLSQEDRQIVEFKTAQYTKTKLRALSVLTRTEYNILSDYSHLPMAHIRLNTEQALNELIIQPEVKRVYIDRALKPVLTQSLPLVNQPSATIIGQAGQGATVAVLDTGVDFTNPVFGGCSSPGIPAGCKVVFSNNGSSDGSGHGTSMAGIVVGVAPNTKIASYDVFSGASTTTDSAVLNGINWAIANKSTYDIRAINMSLSRNVGGVGGCDVYYTPGMNAQAVGILPIAAAGNDGLVDQIGCPADNNQIIGVGAVYDANVGAKTYAGICSDASTRADQITCFSNSWWTMELLAPGAVIDVAGGSGSGTSQATAMASGAAAILSNLVPTLSVYGAIPGNPWATELGRRLTKSSITITDPRNNYSFPRLNLSDAIRPFGDEFSAANSFFFGLNGQPYNNINATKEAGEPNHAGNAGGRSLWFTLANSNITGLVSIDTQGSTIDTLLAVYTGNAVNTLTLVASNDDNGAPNGASSLTFDFQSSQTYYIAIDGKNGASGLVFANTKFAPPLNDDFINAEILSGSSGSITPASSPNNIGVATSEPGEPLHAGQVGGGSVWFEWTAPQSGQVIMDTVGSGFDTLLGVYQGNSVTTLLEIASNDDDGSTQGTSKVVFWATAGNTYKIAVDSKQNGAPAVSSGVIQLDWSTNPNARSDLAVTSVTSSPNPPWLGGAVQYTALITNSGPDFALGLAVSFTFDTNAYSFNTSPQGNCSVSGNIVTCQSPGAMSLGETRTFRVVFDVKSTSPLSTNISVSTNSETPDTNTTDNTVALTNQPILVSAPADPYDNDIPTLPQWGMIFSAALLLLIGMRRSADKRNPRVC